MMCANFTLLLPLPLPSLFQGISFEMPLPFCYRKTLQEFNV